MSWGRTQAGQAGGGEGRRFGPYVTDGEYNATLRKRPIRWRRSRSTAAELLAEKRGQGSAPKKRTARRRRRRRQLPKAGGQEAGSKKKPTAKKTASTAKPAAKKRRRRSQPARRRTDLRRRTRRRGRQGRACRRSEAYGRFQLPWHVESPLLTDIGLALDQVVPRDPGTLPPATVTLMDTADERLQRAGVKVTQQGYGDHGEWFVWGRTGRRGCRPNATTRWALEAELPDEVADLTAPSVDAMPCVPWWSPPGCGCATAVIDDHGAVVATLTSDRIVVRRRGVAAGRFRQVAIDVAGLDPQRRLHHRTFRGHRRAACRRAAPSGVRAGGGGKPRRCPAR